MNLAQTTTTMLLEGLFDRSNHDAWQAFDDRYRPIVVAVARRLGLNAADAADVAQDTMIRFVQAYRVGRYQRGRGRLRSWLAGIARHCVADHFRARARCGEQRGESAMRTLPNDTAFEELWCKERRDELLRRSLAQLKTATRVHDKTLQAFELHVLRHVPAQVVADSLDISVQDVYQAKSRLGVRLQAIYRDLDELYDEAE